MAERTALSDGGYVEWSFEDTTQGGDPKGVLHAQKHAADGSPVGGALDVATMASNYGVWALQGGGFVLGVTQSTMDGQTLAAQLYGADATFLSTATAGSDWHLTASPDGGFLVGSVATQHHQFTAPDSTLTLFSNSGAAVSTATVATTHGPVTSIDADGVLHASWTDGGGNAHTLAFDPEHPQTYAAPPAPGMLSFVDDVGARTGVVRGGGGTDDTTPTIRVPVTQTGWVAVETAYSPSFATEPPMNPGRFVAVTAEDVARGYKDIAVTSPLADNNYGVAARFESADGVVGPQTWIPIRVDTQAPTAPTITRIVDNAGAQQGDVANGGTTDDTSPGVQVSLAGTGAQDHDNVALFDNGQQVSLAPVDAAALQQGYVTLTPAAAAGAHSYTAAVNDFGGNRGAISAAFDMTVDDGGRTITSQQYGDTLTGGAGNDTLVAGQGPDQLTGGGGGDVFSYRQLPWNAGHVTDFTVGTDKLDLSQLFSASGYAGSDPIRDHYVTVQSDGAGGAIVYYDTDGPASGNTIQFKITTLDHVSGSATWAQLTGSGAAPGGQEVNISPASVSHPEGSSGLTSYSFTITRSGDTSQGATTNYRVVGSGTNPADAADFENGWMPNAGFAWDPGETSKLITVKVVGDTTAESDETFSVVLSTPGAGNSNPTPVGPNGTATGVIVNDDAAAPPAYGTVEISPTGVSHSEGDSGVTAYSYTLTRTGDVSQGATTAYKVVGTGAHPADGGDFQGGALPNVTFAWGPGESSRTLTVNVVGDGVAEADETFNVVLQSTAGSGSSNPTAIGANSTAGGTIVNDDVPPGDGGRTINSTQYGDTLTGGAGADTLNAGRGPDQLTGAGGGDVFAYRDLPWNAGRITDFTVGSDRVDLSALFAASGYTGSDPIGDGYVSLQPDGAGGANLYYDTDGRASGNTIQFKIADLEHVSSSASWAQLTGGGAAPGGQQVNISPASVSHSEGQAGLTAYSFTITRSGDTTQGATTSYRVVGSGEHPADASDFQNGWLPSVTFAWNNGETSKVITVNVAGDTTAESDETFSVVLQTPGAGNSNPTPVGPNGTATGVIVNDDTGGTAGRTITSSQYGDTLTGGADNDTLVAGQGPDRLTGGGGADMFVWQQMPWNAGHVTDFTPGVDKLDFRSLFASSTYHGTDPIGDHRLEFRSDGAGNTQVYIDRDDPNSGDWPFLITTLDGVSPSQIGAGDWIFH